MILQKLRLIPYKIPFLSSQVREGILLELTTSSGKKSLGDIAPLPGWSQETLLEARLQIQEKTSDILSHTWDEKLELLSHLNLLPSCSFALESALLSLLDPLPESSLPSSALLMGTYEEILLQAEKREQEGFKAAKLKVSNHSFLKAASLMDKLHKRFRLRIDVNRAWGVEESLHFFSEFPLDLFDYVEEPFKDPKRLAEFLHPLAVDESFPKDLCLRNLETLPTLKAIVYKPTVQGALLQRKDLLSWLKGKNVELVLSSCFESPIGLQALLTYANRLKLSSPLGLGTLHHMDLSSFQEQISLF